MLRALANSPPGHGVATARRSHAPADGDAAVSGERLWRPGRRRDAQAAIDACSAAGGRHRGGADARRLAVLDVHSVFSRNVTIDGVTVRNNLSGKGPSMDGINIDSSAFVLVQNCDAGLGTGAGIRFKSARIRIDAGKAGSVEYAKDWTIEDVSIQGDEDRRWL